MPNVQCTLGPGTVIGTSTIEEFTDLQSELVIMFAVAVVLILAWMLALGVVHVASPLIHILLVLGMVFLAWHLLGKRGRVTPWTRGP